MLLLTYLENRSYCRSECTLLEWGFSTFFGPVTLTYLDPMTFVYNLGPYSLEVYRMWENELPTSRLLKVIVLQTYIQIHRRSDMHMLLKLYIMPLCGWSEKLTFQLRLCLVSWAVAPCVWTLRALTRNLLTYLLTSGSFISEQNWTENC